MLAKKDGNKHSPLSHGWECLSHGWECTHVVHFSAANCRIEPIALTLGEKNKELADPHENNKMLASRATKNKNID